MDISKYKQTNPEYGKAKSYVPVYGHFEIQTNPEYGKAYQDEKHTPLAT